MRKRVKGNRYNYIIKFEKYGKTNSFQILSQFKENGQKSTITSVNYIISAIIELICKNDDIYSIIFLNKKLGKKLFMEAVSTFSDKLWIEKLEYRLDEDRSIGGWNSSFRF
jgi:hypothetical protein